MADRLLRTGVAASLAAIALSACSFAPIYKLPKLNQPLPTAFKDIGPWTPAAPADDQSRGPWWTVFNDALLDQLEARIEASNPDLAAALARYDEARALLGQARARLVPEVDATGSFTRDRQSDQTKTPGASTYYDERNLGGTISYEFDLWGRVRNTVTSQRGLAQASAADLASTRLSLQAQLAQAYLSMRSLDADSRVLADAVKAYQRALTLTEARYKDGAATGLDVGRAKTQFETARSLSASTDASRTLYEHAIASLVGQPASTFAIPIDPDAFPKPPAIPVAAASSLLQRRPDVAAAERRAYAANANIGVARAAFFPTLSLEALGGFATLGASPLAAGAAYWTLGPAAAGPVFDGGRRLAAERQAKAEFQEASANYKSVVLSAFQQVEDNLALCNRLADAAQSEASAADAASRTETIATKQYKDGATTYLDVVIAQTAALDAKRTLIGLQTQRLQAAVGLIRALGGGWTNPFG